MWYHPLGHEILCMVGEGGLILNVSYTILTKSPILYCSTLYTVDSQTYSYTYILITSEFSPSAWIQCFDISNIQTAPSAPSLQSVGMSERTVACFCWCVPVLPPRKAMPYDESFKTKLVGCTDNQISFNGLSNDSDCLPVKENMSSGNDHRFCRCQTGLEDLLRSWGPTVTSIWELGIVTRVYLCPEVILRMCWDSIDRTRKEKKKDWIR